MNSISSVFNKVVDTAYGSAISFVFDDEKYFENTFINNSTHKVTGKKLVEKYGLKVIE